MKLPIASNDNSPFWPRGLSRDAAAAYIGVGTTLFDAMVKDGRMPQPKRINARTVWDRLALDSSFDKLGCDDSHDGWEFAA